MRLVVGLGNPGRKYKKTKHNVGFMCLDAYAKDQKESFKKDNKFRGEWLKIDNLVLLKPHTFMNLSGESIRLVMDYYNIDVDDVFIIYDDVALPMGKIRLRQKGSPGGHNGVKSIVQHLGTKEFQRLRIGIDSNPMIEQKDYVLGKFSKEDQKVMNEAIETSKSIIEDFKNNKQFTNIMNQYN